MISPRTHRPDTIHYIDGYHGGVRGASEPGALRDVIQQLEADPDWAISLDIEPATFGLFAKREPVTFATARRLSMGPSPRLVVTGLFFAQPYLQCFLGESGLRHLRLGLAEQRAQLPDADFSVYAPQEPCWATWLPQVLPDFGVEMVVLKSPGTAFAGWAKGLDAHLVDWQAADGSRIETIPRYACEDSVRAWETESRYALPAFVEKCRRLGISHPTGTGLQDFGWRARRAHPFRESTGGEHLHYATWQQWRREVPPASVSHRFTVDDFVPTLPFGDWPLHRLAGAVRRAEIDLLAAERLAAMAWWFSDSPWPEKELDRAWRNCLWAQHHDGWICPDSPMAFTPGEPPWAECSQHEARSASQDAGRVLMNAAHALTDPGPLGSITLVNTAPVARATPVEVIVDLDETVEALDIRDDQGRAVRHQLLPAEHPGDFNAWGHRYARRLLIDHPLSAMGLAGLHISPNTERAPNPAGWFTGRIAGGDTALGWNPAAAGAAESVSLGPLGALPSPLAKHWFLLSGFDPEQGCWHQSTDTSTTLSRTHEGPLASAIKVDGRIGACAYTLDIRVDGTGAIDVRILLDCPDGQPFGNPSVTTTGGDKPGAHRGVGDLAMERHAPWHDDAFKLKIHFDLPAAFTAIDKSSAWDVGRAQAGATRFDSWDQARHRAVLQWLDLRDDAGDRGLAVLCDWVTAYESDGHGGFALVLGWGTGHRSLRGQCESRIRLLPHVGDWRAAGLWSAWQQFQAPVLQLNERLPRHSRSTESWLQTDGLITETLEVEGEDLVLRAWNPSAQGDHELHVSGHRGTWQQENLAAVPIGPRHQGPDMRATVPPSGLFQARLTP
jgi:alpha-mannosidase